jgi:hypothetical protein
MLVSYLPTWIGVRADREEEGKTASDASGSITEVLPIFTDRSMPVAVFIWPERLKSLLVCDLLIGGLPAGATVKRFDVEKRKRIQSKRRDSVLSGHVAGKR